MQYKVPQNVDIEDKVIGPLSLRQFMILLVAAGIILVLNFIFVGIFRMLFYLIALVIGGIAFAFAFVKYGDQKLEIFAFSALKTLRSPRNRVWKKEEEIPQMIKKTQVKAGVGEDKAEKRRDLSEVKNDLENLANLVDSGGYSKIDTKDRVALSEIKDADDSGAKDIIDASLRSKQEFESMIENAKVKIHNSEPSISELASVSPGKKFEYPKIEVK